MTSTLPSPQTGLSPSTHDDRPGQKLQSYFDGLYTTRDPYGTAHRWYERRKRDILLSSLPHSHFDRVFEPACGTGELTRELAARSSCVLASDFCEEAVVQARHRLQTFPNVTLRNQRIPAQWPDGDQAFDLIVVSEVCCFLDLAEIRDVALRCAESLVSHGTLVVCDWRWPFPERVTGADAAHKVFDDLALHPLVEHAEEDFLLRVWSNDPRSVARRESLV